MDKNALNEVYKTLETKALALCTAFKGMGLSSCRMGYYGGHYNKNEQGNYERDYFPIPVIELENLCDIEIGLKKISITTRLKKVDALAFDYTKIKDYNFEAYGIVNYLQDYYVEGNTVDQLLENVRNSIEEVVGFAFYFDFTTSVEQIDNTVQLLYDNGFFY